MRRIDETEGGGGNAVIDFENGTQAGEIGRTVSAGGAQPGPHAAHKTALIEPVVPVCEPPRASGQIQRGGNRTYAANQMPRGFSEFAGKLQHYISPEGEASQKDRTMAFASEFLQNKQQIAGQTGVLEGLAESFGSTTSTHMKAVRAKSRPQSNAAQTADIARLA
jgi:hypothetical protein